MKEVLLMSYEEQLKELEIIIGIQSDVRDEQAEFVELRIHQLIDDEIVKALFGKEVLRRRIEQLKVEIENEEES